MNRKGNYQDVFHWIEFALAFIIIAGVVLVVQTNFNTRVQATNVSVIPAEVKATSAGYTTDLPKYLDYVFVVMYMVFIIISVVAARFINSDPKFIVVGIIALIFIVIAGMFVENIWDAWAQQPTINAAISGLSIVPFMMNHAAIFAFIYGLIVAIALLSKEQGN